MKALLLVAHGSRRQQSNEEVIQLAECLKRKSSGEFEVVHAAFLELADPLIPEGIRRCAEAGVTSITILPYFLNTGRHVAEDIPGIVDETRPLYPDVEINLARHLGTSEMMVDLLYQSAASA